MRKLNKVLSILLLLNYLLIYKTKSQDLFNKENSLKYAFYLYYAKEYELALYEFDRIIFLDSTDLHSKIFYLKCLRYLNKYNEGIIKYRNFFYNHNEVPIEAKKEYAKILIKAKYFDKADNIIDKEFSRNDTILYFLKTSSLLYQNKFLEAENLLKSSDYNYPFVSEYDKIITKYKNTRFKKPYLSFIYSTILPGSGKIYAGEWLDGLVNFVMVAVPAYQAYRGFMKKGFNSPYGWIYGSIALTFYGGNIYGSVKSTNKYNKKKLQILKNEIDIVFDKY